MVDLEKRRPVTAILPSAPARVYTSIGDGRKGLKPRWTLALSVSFGPTIASRPRSRALRPSIPARRFCASDDSASRTRPPTEAGLLNSLRLSCCWLSRRRHPVDQTAHVAPKRMQEYVRQLGVRLNALQRHRRAALGADRDAERWSHSGPTASPKQAMSAPAATAAMSSSIGSPLEGDCLFWRLTHQSAWRSCGTQ